MDFQSAMETFAEAWVAANTKGGPLADVSVQNQALALTRNCKTPPPTSTTSTTTGATSAGGGSGRESTERTADTPSLTAAAAGRSGTPLEHTISPHSIKEEFDPSKTPSSGKSIPVHCIVEAVISLEESTWRRRPLIETDSYVIIPMATAFQGLVQAALLRLGYPADTAAAARGSVLIRNWKPLSFDQISEDPLTTVGDILGELATVATLKIQVFRGRPGLASDLKDKLLKFLLVQSHGLLLSTGCPLDELALSQICRGGPSTCGVSTPDISDEMRRKFDQWWAEQFGPQSPVPGTIARSQLGNPFCTQYASAHQQATAAAAKMDYQQHQNIHSQQPMQQRRSPASSLGGDHSGAGGGHPALQAVHGQYHQAAVQKTRMRTSFDPELELPKLQRWFNENQHPSRQQIQHYVKELNSLESRRGRKPLDINNVVYWFKNARAAQKRAETRGVSAASGPCHLAPNATVNGYSPTNGVGGSYHHRLIPDATGYLDQHRLKGDLSPAMATGSVHQSSSVQVGSDELSNIGSDMEDEEDLSETRASSPARPLSLTTTRKGQDSREASPCSSTPVPPPDIQQQQRECKEEPRNEPLNYHSSPDHINNNNNNTKLQLSDAEEEEDEEADLDQERGSGGSPGRPASRYCQSPEPMSDLPLVPRPCGVQGGGADGIDRLTAGFPLVPNSMFSHSIMYMSHYIPGLSHHHPGAGSSGPGPAAAAAGVGGLAALSADERRKRNRTFIDPVTEVPRLEQWFSLNTHPSQNLIVKYTEELNCMAYRQKFPRLEPKNVQFWFKNRRAKNKRLKMSIFDTHHPSHYHHTERD